MAPEDVKELRKRFIMKKDSIGFFKSILESYEELAIFSVIDGKKGLIEMIYPASMKNEIVSIMADMVNYGISFKEVRDA